MRHILSVLVENEAGALARMTGLFAQRGYNIESLTVAPTEDPTLSRMTIITSGSQQQIEQITRQVNKLVDVFTAVDITGGEHIERELLLIKLNPEQEGAVETFNQLTESFKGYKIDLDEHCVAQLVGTCEEIGAFLLAMDGLEVEVVRSGALGIAC